MNGGETYVMSGLSGNQKENACKCRRLKSTVPVLRRSFGFRGSVFFCKLVFEKAKLYVFQKAPLPPPLGFPEIDRILEYKSVV